VRAPWSAALVAWLPVHGPRQEGPVTPDQVSCSEMGRVLSLGDAAKSIVRSKVLYLTVPLDPIWIVI